MSEHSEHDQHHHAGAARADGRALTKLALSATLHCATGCSIGEVLGLVISNGLGWGNAASIALATALAFLIGYSLTMGPLLRAKIPFARAAALAGASDTFSILAMEVVDNLVMLVIPGAMSAGLGQPLYWISMALSLVLGAAAAFPVNRWLIARGRGHAVLHDYHSH